MSRILYRIGHSAGLHPWRVLAAWVLLVLATFALNGAVGGSPDETFRLPGAESQAAADAIKKQFPEETVFSSNVILHDDDGLTTPQAKAAVSQAVEQLADGDHVIAAADPYDPRGPTLSVDGTTAFITVAYDKERLEVAEYEQAEDATKVLADAGIQVEYDGGLGYAKGDSEPGSEQIGIAVAIVVLAIAFGSLVAMSLPIAVALIGIVIGSSTIGIMSGFLAMPNIASIVGMMLGLGVGIDYALFILARHRQNLESGVSVPVAVGQANATAGLSVLFAGSTVIVAIAGLVVAGVPMMSMMGWASAVMVAITMLASITLLPALLGLVGRKVNSARIPFIKQKPAYNPASKSARWTKRVVAHPVRYATVAGGILVALSIPTLSMHLGFADAGNDGESTTTRKAYDLVADAYGPGTNGPLEVVLKTHGDADAARVVSDVAADIAALDGVASVGEPTINADQSLAVIHVVPTTSPQDEATAELLAELRDDVLPQAVAGSDVEPLVTGGTALSDDVSSRLQSRMLWFLGAVIGLSFLVLTVVFRSVLVPLKAAVLNVLGVAASYGIVVAMFQWGWAKELIGVQETVPIMPLAPMLMFAILFGLSMDYEVFLLSRVREQFLRHGDAKAAIVEGVGSTARVITSAALIMISVFGAFILSNDVTTKMFGVGLSVAVLLDVTLVRMVLVPAAMSLLGDRAWWLPRWLDRLLPVIDLEGGSELAESDESDESDASGQDKELVLA